VDQLQIVTMAADPARSAQAAIVALQAGIGPEQMARTVVGDSTVAIVDTPAGRVCVESVTSGQRRYQVLSPGSRSDISGAVQRLIRRLPAGEEWYSYRRVV
jgi:ESX secretion-associated protein EspG